jgi:hypothetical protein
MISVGSGILQCRLTLAEAMHIHQHLSYKRTAAAKLLYMNLLVSCARVHGVHGVVSVVLGTENDWPGQWTVLKIAILW